MIKKKILLKSKINAIRFLISLREENADERKSSIDLIEENNSKEEQQLVQNFNDHKPENNFPDPLKNDQFVSENGFSEDIQEENK